MTPQEQFEAVRKWEYFEYLCSFTDTGCDYKDHAAALSSCLAQAADDLGFDIEPWNMPCGDATPRSFLEWYRNACDGLMPEVVEPPERETEAEAWERILSRLKR